MKEKERGIDGKKEQIKKTRKEEQGRYETNKNCGQKKLKGFDSKRT